MSYLDVIQSKRNKDCSAIELLIKDYDLGNCNHRTLENAARELDRLRQIEIAANAVIRSSSERTREIDNLVYAINKIP